MIVLDVLWRGCERHHRPSPPESTQDHDRDLRSDPTAAVHVPSQSTATAQTTTHPTRRRGLYGQSKPSQVYARK